MDNSEPLKWCVVANVADRTTHGPGGAEVQVGLKHFSPGTKLWIVSAYWGNAAEDVEVVGKHRGDHRQRLARMVVARRHLTNFRASAVYSPAVLRELTVGWDSREEAEADARRWAMRQ